MQLSPATLAVPAPAYPGMPVGPRPIRTPADVTRISEAVGSFAWSGGLSGARAAQAAIDSRRSVEEIRDLVAMLGATAWDAATAQDAFGYALACPLGVGDMAHVTDAVATAAWDAPLEARVTRQLWESPRSAADAARIVERVAATSWRAELEARISVAAAYSPRSTADILRLVRAADALGASDDHEARVVEQQLDDH